MNLEKILKLAVRLGLILEEKKLSLVTVESCTGGWLAHTLTSVPTSSTWFERGFVTYSNDSKVSMVNVRKETLDAFGAVSQETALEMAEGALKNSLAQISIAITGVAGPKSIDEVPVGTCWLAWAGTNLRTGLEFRFFKGDRLTINYQAIEFALKHLLKILKCKEAC